MNAVDKRPSALPVKFGLGSPPVRCGSPIEGLHCHWKTSINARIRTPATESRAAPKAGASRGKQTLGSETQDFSRLCSGVGKSYRMLDEARRRHERGEDVIVGAVQGRQSEEVQALLERLELIPPLQTPEV